ncbi:recombinase family protein [uncultured Vagococcus sp.]|uniref:recombinase family protein n=1 Tax=uncultured Vagococcus sp. TaxID=189676 RepID=UPI0028D04807|nr:recombinase family protein [uncultured Vagococcus sp.]
MTVFGYARKDYPSQIAIQLNKLMTYNCEKVFVENQSFNEESELKEVLGELRQKDVLVVDSLAVFGKRIKKLTELLKMLEKRQIRLISVTEALDTMEPWSFATTAEVLCSVDSECQSQYTKERLAISKSNGQHLGRPTIKRQTIEEIQRLHHQHKLNYREISLACGVSLGSVHKYISYDLAQESQ